MKFRCEPARLIALLTALVTVGVAFGLDLSSDQQTALLALATAILGAGEVTRSQVVPVAKHEEQVKEALYTRVPPEYEHWDTGRPVALNHETGEYVSAEYNETTNQFEPTEGEHQ